MKRLIPASLQFYIMSKLVGGPRAARQLGVAVGEGCRIYSMDVASERWLLSIGNRVTVSVGVQFITHDGTGWLVSKGDLRRYRYAPISIGDRSFVGSRSIIMPGVRIGSDVIVAAGSVVTKSVPDGCVVGGNPARVIAMSRDLLARIQRDWPSSEDMVGETYRQRVDSIVDPRWKPYLSNPEDGANS